jgi:hypothetical protein
MANIKNTFFDSITDKRSIPYNSTGTGTIETIGNNLRGAGTLFKTELKVGSWIVSLTQDEVRKVISIESDTAATLQAGFTVDIAAASALVYCPPSRYVEISVVIPPGLAAGEIDGKALPAGVPVGWGKGSRERSATRDLVDPIIVDAADTTMLIQTLE